MRLQKILVSMILISLMVLSSIPSSNLSNPAPSNAHTSWDWTPPANTWVWNTNATGNWNVASNWLDSSGSATVPDPGAIVIFNGTGTGNCYFNRDASLESISFNTGWTGVFNNSASCDVTTTSDIIVSSGVLTSSVSAIWSCDGNFTQQTGSTITANVLCLVMTGSGNTVTLKTLYYLRSLRISDDTTITTSLSLFGINTGALIVDSGKTLTIASGKNLAIYDYQALTNFDNNGIITGGTFTIYIITYNAIWDNIGTINSPIAIVGHSTMTNSYAITLGDNAIFGSTLSISSGHATRILTFDLSASNYALSCTDLTIGTRAIINCRDSLVTVSGNLDSTGADAVWIEGTSTLKMTGASKTITMSAGQSLYNLTIPVTASITLASNIAVTHTFLWDAGTFSLATYTFDNTGGSTVMDHNTNFIFATAGTFIAGTDVILDALGSIDISTITFVKGTSLITKPGTGILKTGTNQLYDLKVSGGTTSQTGDLIVSHNMQIIGGATYNPGNFNKITVGNAFSLAGTIIQRTIAWEFGTYTQTSGKFTQGADISSGSVTASGGILELKPNKNWSCSASWNTIGATLITNYSTVIMNGTGSISISADQYFYNLRIDTPHQIFQMTDISIANVWDVTVGSTFNGDPTKTIYLSGNATIQGWLWVSSTNLNMLGSGTSLIMNSANPINRLQINGSAVQLISTAGVFAKTMMINSGASAIINQDSSVTNRLIISGDLDTNAHKFTISGSNTHPLYANGSWNGIIYLSGSAVSFDVTISELSPGWLHFSKTTAINLHSDPGLITVIPTGGSINITISKNHPGETTTGESAYTFSMTGVSDCSNVNVTCSNLYPISPYTLFIDGSARSWKNSTALGDYSFDYNSTSSNHIFRIVVGSIPEIAYSPPGTMTLQQAWALTIIFFIVGVVAVSIWRGIRTVTKEQEFWMKELQKGQGE